LNFVFNHQFIICDTFDQRNYLDRLVPKMSLLCCYNGEITLNL